MSEQSIKELAKWWINSNRLPKGSSDVLKAVIAELEAANRDREHSKNAMLKLKSQLEDVTKERDNLLSEKRMNTL